MRLALIHGFTQTGRSWAPVAERLTAQIHDVQAPDLPGHGSKPAADTDLWSTAASLAEEVGPATWVGYSMGGRVCLHIALARPDVVEGLVLVSTTAGIEDPEAARERRAADELLAQTVERDGVPAFIDRWLAGPLWATLSPEDRGVGARLENTSAGLAASLRHAGTGSQEPLWGRLDEVRVPTLVVTGQLDERFTSLGDRLAAAIGPDSSRVTIPGAGHALCWEAPDLFVTAVTTWLSEQRARP